PARMTIGEAEEVSRRAMEDVASEDAVGRISAEFVYLYPPGIPILAPGEEILEKTVKDIENCKVLGLEVQNMTADGRFRVIGR
ncbi:MAG: ornithine decarboxylase, partial [Lachnospiraceae bacterium]|nr:ornithine decarboxylase [Lachnospiraceae bacterium]